MTESIPTKPIHSVKRFYFLEYFYVLLKSVEKYREKELVFNYFKNLKHQHRLGESKYKRLGSDVANLSEAQLGRYRYTFQEVIDEAKEYDLLAQDTDGDILHLTEKGRELLRRFEEKGPVEFNQSLLHLMETRYGAFRYLIEFLYKANKFKGGLIIFPNYSPRQLHFEKSSIKSKADLVKYSKTLVQKLEEDIEKYLGEKRDLSPENDKLLFRLEEASLLPAALTDRFASEKYNAITKRIRDFWITYFLREIYEYEYSMNSFDIWTYRGKQIGVIQATEFYPNFDGRIVYPTSVVLRTTTSNDFKPLHSYRDGYSLFRHEPKGEKNQERFVDSLVKAYFDLRRSNRSYFISLSALREIVCYNMKISEALFESFLDTTYKLNLAGELKIRIALEVDKLPEETKAMYLKREPVMVDGRFRNIIAIDLTKGDKYYEEASFQAL